MAGLVTRMVYMITRHSLQGRLMTWSCNKGKFSVAFGQVLEEKTMVDILILFATLVQYDRILSQAGYKTDVSLVFPKPKVALSLCAQIW